MRKSAFVVLTLAAAAAFAPQPASAAYDLPWCAQYADAGNILSCAFTSYQQCMATVRGIGGYCRPNYRYGFYRPDVQPHRTKRHDSDYR